MLERFTTADASSQVLASLRRLLDEAFEGELTDDDWDHTVGGCHVVVLSHGDVVAHASVVPRRLEVGGLPVATGYVEGVAVAPRRQGEGLGTRVMRQVGELITEDYEMGALATGAHHFYARLGWEPWRGPTYVRTDAGLVRTEEEDDAVMVLRHGPSAALDVTLPISCETRSGDDW